MPQYRPPESFGPIQIIPPGLLGFLGLKSAGENPHSLLAEYRPTLEMRDWLLMARAEYLMVGFAAGSIGGNLTGTVITDSVSSVPGTFVVPVGEWWWFHDATFSLAPGAAATDVRGISLGMTVQIAAAVGYLALGQSSFVGTNQASHFNVRDFWAPPGASLAFTANVVNAAATNTAALAGWVTKIRV